MRERLFQLLSNIFDMKVSDVHESLTKEQVYKWDSLVQMELVAAIEKEFEIQLMVDDIIAMDSVSNIINVLLKYGVAVNAA